MIPNKGLDRLFEPKSAAPPVDRPAAIPTEEVDVEMWTFELPLGPLEFTIIPSRGDFIKEEKDRFSYRCGIGDGKVLQGNVYKQSLYVDRHFAARMNVRVVADPHVPFTPTKGKK